MAKPHGMISRFFFLALIFLSLPLFALDAEVVFNEPGFHDRPSKAVENKYVSLIDQATPGSSIHMAMYQFTRLPVAEALVRASHRDVNVRLVLDGGNYIDQMKPGNAVTLLTSDALKCSEKPCVKFCFGPVQIKIKDQTFGTGCNGLVINHNKFMLLSKLDDGSKNVSVQSSSNLSDEDLHQYQDILTIKNDKGLYDGYLDYWQMLYRDHTRLTPHKDIRGSGPVHASFFPRIVNKDPVMKLLRRVSCEIPGSNIRVAEADFNRLNVASRLQELKKQGCDVKVITRLEPAMFSPAVGVATRLGSSVLILPYRSKNPEYRSVNSVHTKMILIDAALDDSDERRQVVATGSHNLDFFSLRTNDETLLEVEDKAVYDQYIRFWSRLNEDARTSDLNLLEGNDRSDAIDKNLSPDGAARAEFDSRPR
jgi:hypothetical protein